MIVVWSDCCCLISKAVRSRRGFCCPQTYYYLWSMYYCNLFLILEYKGSFYELRQTWWHMWLTKATSWRCRLRNETACGFSFQGMRENKSSELYTCIENGQWEITQNLNLNIKRWQSVRFYCETWMPISVCLCLEHCGACVLFVLLCELSQDCNRPVWTQHKL